MNRFYIPYGEGKQHAAQIKDGLSNLPSNFAAEPCWCCHGEGQYEQTYTNGCGGGYSTMIGQCEYCNGLGLMQGGKPAHFSVLNQVMNAAKAGLENESRRTG